MRFKFDKVDDTTNKITEYSNCHKFPNLGAEHHLYIDKKNDEIYRWDSKKLKYYCVSTNYNNIAIIDGNI